MDKNKRDKSICGVYIITCLANGKVYIGSSGNIRQRLFNHYSELNRGSHHVENFQADYDNYGRPYFHERILEELDLSAMDDYVRKCEAKWQKLYRSAEIGYNKVDENKNCYVVDDEYFGNIVCINKFSNETVVCKSLEVSTIIGIPISWCNKMMKYWSTVLNGLQWTGPRPLKHYKGWIFIKETEYSKEFDYINFKEPRKVVTELKINIPYAERDLHRVPLRVTSIVSGETTIYPSAAELIREKGFLKAKIYLCTVGKKKTYKGYTIAKVTE